MNQNFAIWKISLLLLLGLCEFLFVIASTVAEVYVIVSSGGEYTKEIFLRILPGVIFCYSMFLIATVVFLKKIQDRTAHVFYLMLLFWALAIHNALGLGSSLFKFVSPWFALTLLPAWPLAVGLFLHFYLSFPVEKKVFQSHRRLLLILIYTPTALILPFIYATHKQLGWANSFINYGWGIWLSIYFTAAMLALGHSRRRAPNPYIKKQAQIMSMGTTLGLAVWLSVYWLPLLLFNRKLPFAEFSALLLIFWPGALAYVIVKHRFMNIDVIVKRGVAYAITSGFVVAAYFILVAGLGQLVVMLTGSTSQIFTILATLLIAALFNPVRQKVRNFVDRRFYPSRFVYREAFRTFTHQMISVVDLQRLLHGLQTFLAVTIHIRPVALLWKNNPENMFVVKTLEGIELPSPPSFTAEDKAIKHLQNTKQLLDLSALLDQPGKISPDEKKRWLLLDAELLMPLFSKGELCGALSLGVKGEDDPYYKEDLDLLSSLGDQVNISLENAVLTEELREQDRLKKELEVARRIQLGSLPQADPQIAGLDISGVSIPALEVGGDYYDYLSFPDDRFGVVIGDVSGKGTSAALYMSQLKGVLQTASRYHRSLKDLMIEVNAITFDNIELQSYITLLCGAFDVKSRKLHIVKAGHLPLIHYSANDRSFRELAPRGLGIGLEYGKIFQAELEEAQISFAPGDVFLFYTDGIIDARNSDGKEFETKSLLNVIQENGCDTACDLRERIISQVRQFTAGASQVDDMTLVVVKAIN
jgi:serine phosphatase RsbU (regulator of sigma subunit)